MPNVSGDTPAVLRLALAPGCGPVLIRRMIEAFGSPEGVLGASASQLERVKGIGTARATEIRAGLEAAAPLVEAELARAEQLGVGLITLGSPAYPPLLAQLPDAPAVLYCRGTLDPHGADRYTVAIVGSRECSAYGIEQARRFAGVLAGAGLTVVSGGARGIDSAAHRGAMVAQGRTLCVLGCGLAHVYPPENADLFRDVSQRFGAVLSELPLDSPPRADNFPARNRIIAGLSLGTLVIEAGERSGALITARLAAEDYNREVMALPGRVDAPASRGTLKLIKQGGAALVTDPGDVLALLETPARHSHAGTHEARYGVEPAEVDAEESQPALFGAPDVGSGAGARAPIAPVSPLQATILAALEEPRTLDELCGLTRMSAAALRSELTVMEIHQRVTRTGSKFQRRA